MTPAKDPYTPPTSNVETTPHLLPPRRGWTAYFWLLTALMILSVSGLLTIVELQPLDLLDLSVTGVGALGLFGFARRRVFGNVRFWRRWLPIEVGWDLLVQFVLVPSGAIWVFADAEPSAPTDDLYTMLFILPLYIALYRYAYRSPELWTPAMPGELTRIKP